MSIIQIAFIGITGVLIAVWFGEVKKEYSILIMIAASILIFSFGISKLGQIFKTIETLPVFLNLFDLIGGLI